MDRFETLRIFAAVADQGGFSTAARALGLSPPAVTRAIAALERHLGVPLLHRSTRAVALTDEGAAFLERARSILAALREAEQEAIGARSVPHGQIYITAPTLFGRLHVLPVIAALLDRHPGLSARMLLIDRNVRIVEEGIDVAIRIGALADSALHAASIGSVRQIVAASPDHLARHGVPRDAGELANRDTIASTGVRISNDWSFVGRTVTVKPRIAVNTVDAALAAAEAGLGFVRLLSYQVAEAIAAGRLVRVLDDQAPPPIPIHLLFDRARTAMPAVRAFIDAMRERAAEGHWN